MLRRRGRVVNRDAAALSGGVCKAFARETWRSSVLNLKERLYVEMWSRNWRVAQRRKVDAGTKSHRVSLSEDVQTPPS
jgi:hypothetical protein